MRKDGECVVMCVESVKCEVGWRVCAEWVKWEVGWKVLGNVCEV